MSTHTKPYILFVSPDDGTVCVSPNGAIPKIANVTLTKKFLNQLREIKRQPIELYTIYVQDVETVHVVSISRRLKTDVETFFASIPVNVSWVEAASIKGHNSLLDNVFNSSNIVASRMNGEAFSEQDARSTILQATQNITQEIGIINNASQAYRSRAPKSTDTTRGISTNDEIYNRALAVKAFIDADEELLKLLSASDEETSVYTIITRLTAFAYLRRFFEYFKKLCRQDARPLTDEEREVLNLSILLAQIGKTETGLSLVDAKEGSLWVPNTTDPLDPSSRRSRIGTSLMPSLNKEDKVHLRGLAITI